MPEKYYEENFAIHRETRTGPEMLCNFIARIEREIIYHDGPTTTTHVEISGKMPPPAQPQKEGEHEHAQEEPKPHILPTITIPANEFDSLNWVAKKWGMKPVIFSVPNAKSDIAIAIQLASTPTQVHVYTATGWHDIDNRPTYITTSGGINAAGLNPNIQVQLPQELRHYHLPEPINSREAFLASIRLINLGPSVIMWPLLLATYRPAIRPSDFAVHLAGRTGTFKSEITALMQSHYGPAMDARHLPASWSSTANALEHLAYRAKDALMATDDFVPTGTAWQVRQLQKSADQIFRAQGNQAGRSRLTETTAMQTTYYPRGLLLSTGEDVPEGHSIRGRMMILEIAPGQITPQKLSDAQAKRPMYSLAMADFIHWLAKNPEKADEHRAAAMAYRDEHLGVGHTRTPPMLGELIATAGLLAQYGREREFIAPVQANEILGKAKKMIVMQGENQKQYLEAADPVIAFCDTIKTLLNSHLAHVKTRNGGIPDAPELWGWTKQQASGQLPTYHSNGPTVGHIDMDAGEFLFDQGTMQFVKKYAAGRLAMTTATIVKRIAEAGLLTRKDDHRERNTVRVNIDGHQRNVLAIDLNHIRPDQVTEPGE